MWPQFVNPFPGPQLVLWIVLAAIPPLVVLLYFLKLRRRDVEVPSTYLWYKSIEDLHVNTIWQRLRRNLLLFLQLLLLALVTLALVRPHWRGRQLPGERFVFLLDASASMQATDVGPSRFDEARRRIGEMIDQLPADSAAMLISFSDAARVEQPFTRDRRLLRRALQNVRATDRRTSLVEALRVAAGLAHSPRGGAPASAGPEAGALPGSAAPTELYIVSDGRFEPVSQFRLGSLRPRFVAVGNPQARNVAIAALNVRRKQGRFDQWEAFARLDNHASEAADASLELWLDDRLLDADRLSIPPGESRGVAFDLGQVESGVLRLKNTVADDLMIDNEARLVLQPPRPARVLLVTPGNEPLELALTTRSIARLAQLTIEPPAALKTPKLRQAVESGAFDLVVFDRCQGERMPAANTLWIGAVPSEGGWGAKPSVALPQVIDVETAHPLIQWLDLGDVDILDATPLAPPPGATVLVDSGAGPLMAIAPRERFEDAVLGFRLIDEPTDGGTGKYIGTNWPIRASFPVFVLNVIEYLGGARRLGQSEAIGPGGTVSLDASAPNAKLTLRYPSGKSIAVEADNLGKLGISDTGEVGVYEVRESSARVGRFAVNLFDVQESRIAPDPAAGNWTVQVGHAEVAAQADWQTTRREAWKLLLILGLLVLLLEWYIYSRRVSL